MSGRHQLRKHKLEKSIAQGLSEIILIEMNDDRIKPEMISIARIELNEDFSTATVFFKILNPEKKNKITKWLYQSAGYLRSQLTKKVLIKNMPRLKFFYDYNEGEDVTNLIEKLSAKYQTKKTPTFGEQDISAEKSE